VKTVQEGVNFPGENSIFSLTALLRNLKDRVEGRLGEHRDELLLFFEQLWNSHLF